MSADNMNDLVRTLEQKLEKLLTQISAARAESQKLKDEMKSLREENTRLSKELAALRLAHQTQAGAVHDRLVNLGSLLDRLDQELA